MTTMTQRMNGHRNGKGDGHGDSGIDDLVAELARVHKVVVEPGDPVAMLLTANRFLLRETAAAQEERVREFGETVATASSDWQQRLNKKTEAALNATVAAAKQAVAAGVESGLAAALPELLKTVEAVQGRTERQLRRAHRLVCVLIAIVSLLGLAVAAGAWLLLLPR